MQDPGGAPCSRAIISSESVLKFIVVPTMVPAEMRDFLRSSNGAAIAGAMRDQRQRFRRPTQWARQVVEGHPTATAYIIAFLSALAAGLTQGAKAFQYDSAAYWELADSFTRNGSFSLLNYADGLRGYALPLLNLLLSHLADVLDLSASFVVTLFNALVVAFIGAVLAPLLAQRTWSHLPWRIGRRLALTALLIVFWLGYIIYPLSDFPALLLALVAVLAASHRAAPGWLALAGATSALAVVVRPSYVLLAILAPLLAVWEWRSERPTERPTRGRFALSMALFAFAFAIVAVPQSLAAHRHHGTWSFIPGTSEDLSGFQLTSGLQMQRYETYIGQDKPSGSMRYLDAGGLRLLHEEAGGAIHGPGDYAKLVWSHPVTMVGLLVRHTVNGLDQRYSTPYVENLDTGSLSWQRLAGFLLVFLAMLRIAWPQARRCLGPARWRYPAAIALCCATALPSAMETRFLLPLHLLSYLLALAPGWPSPLRADRRGSARLRTPAAILATYLGYMLIVWQIVNGATDGLRFG